MKDLREKKGQKITAGALTVLVLVLFVVPYQLNADACDRALEDCLIDALIVGAVAFLGGLIGGPGSAFASAGAAAGGYSAFCATGWAFCKAYYI